MFWNFFEFFFWKFFWIFFENFFENIFDFFLNCWYMSIEKYCTKVSHNHLLSNSPEHAFNAVSTFFRRFFSTTSCRYGTLSGRREWTSAQSANPSAQDELKLVTSISLYPAISSWTHFSSAFRFDPHPYFFDNCWSGSLFVLFVLGIEWVESWLERDLKNASKIFL